LSRFYVLTFLLLCERFFYIYALCAYTLHMRRVVKISELLQRFRSWQRGSVCRGHNVRQSAESTTSRDLHQRAYSVRSERLTGTGSDMETRWKARQRQRSVFPMLR